MRNPASVETIAKAIGLTTWASFIERACATAKVVYLLGGWRGGKSLSAAFIVFIAICLDLIWKRST